MEALFIFTWEVSSLLGINSKFGKRLGYNGVWNDQSGVVGIPAPPPSSEKVFADHIALCKGCPYAKHGVVCRDADGSSCLRADMMAIEQRARARRQGKEEADDAK